MSRALGIQADGYVPELWGFKDNMVARSQLMFQL